MTCSKEESVEAGAFCVGGGRLSVCNSSTQNACNFTLNYFAAAILKRKGQAHHHSTCVIQNVCVQQTVISSPSDLTFNQHLHCTDLNSVTTEQELWTSNFLSTIYFTDALPSTSCRASSLLSSLHRFVRICIVRATPRMLISYSGPRSLFLKYVRF